MNEQWTVLMLALSFGATHEQAEEVWRRLKGTSRVTSVAQIQTALDEVRASTAGSPRES